MRALFLALALSCMMPRDEAIARLRDPNPDTRLIAVQSLRNERITDDVVIALDEAVAHETVEKNRAGMLLLLGKSGSPRAKRTLEELITSAATHEEQLHAGRALRTWAIQTGAVNKEYDFPEMWPYGTQGYPPIIE